MSEPIKSQSISRRRLFWLAVTAAALAAPATILSTSDVRAQQSDQAPAAEPTAPKTGEKKKKENEEEGNAGSYDRSSEQSANTTKTAVVLGRRNEKPQPIGAAGAKFVTSRPVRAAVAQDGALRRCAHQYGEGSCCGY